MVERAHGAVPYRAVRVMLCCHVWWTSLAVRVMLCDDVLLLFETITLVRWSVSEMKGNRIVEFCNSEDMLHLSQRLQHDTACAQLFYPTGHMRDFITCYVRKDE